MRALCITIVTSFCWCLNNNTISTQTGKVYYITYIPVYVHNIYIRVRYVLLCLNVNVMHIYLKCYTYIMLSMFFIYLTLTYYLL